MCDWSFRRPRRIELRLPPTLRVSCTIVTRINLDRIERNSQNWTRRRSSSNHSSQISSLTNVTGPGEEIVVHTNRELSKILMLECDGLEGQDDPSGEIGIDFPTSGREFKVSGFFFGSNMSIGLSLSRTLNMRTNSADPGEAGKAGEQLKTRCREGRGCPKACYKARLRTPSGQGMVLTYSG